MTDTIESEIQKLAPSARIELFEVDATAIGGSVERFHSGTNGLRQIVVWQGNEYPPFPIQATGFDISGQGPSPRPKLSIADVDGLVGALCDDLDDLTGATLIRHRTFATFLDAVNFTGGNPNANPDEEAVDVWFIDRKATEIAGEVVEFELASAFDIQDAKIPARQMIQNLCPWEYRGEECGYAGGPVSDVSDVPTSNPAKDGCGKRVFSCGQRMEFLAFGGFPGLGLTRI